MNFPDGSMTILDSQLDVAADFAILRTSVADSPELISKLKRASKYFSEHLTVSDIVEKYPTFQNLSILVYTESDAKSLTVFAETLLQTKALYRAQLVLVGPKSTKHLNNLNAVFREVMAIDWPCPVDKILNALGLDLEKSIVSESSSELTNLKPSAAQVLATEVAGIKGKLDGVAIKYVTEDFKNAEESLFGVKDAFKAHLLEVFSRSSSKARKQIVRVTETVCEVASRIKLSSQKDTLALVSAYFLRTVLDVGPNQLKENSELRNALIGPLNSVAMKFRQELSASNAADVMECASMLIQGADNSHSDTVFQSASLVVGFELLDRTLFTNSGWTPRNAKTFLQRAKKGDLSNLHPEVALVLVRTVLESILTDFRDLLRNGFGAVVKPKLTESTIVPNSEELTLADLEPGMRLAKPIEDAQGKSLVDANVILDADLIWRLWILATNKKISNPLVFHASAH